MPRYQEESFLGSGDLQLAVYKDGVLLGERDVGNASQFVINPPTLEKKELIGMRRANYSQTIKSVITKTEQELKFTLTDINRKNLALAMFGEDAVFTQAAGTATEESITARLDAWSKLENRKIVDTAGSKPVVTNADASVTYVEDTHYLVDYQVGRIQALSGGTITEGQELKVTYGYQAIEDGWKVASNKVSQFECFLRLIGRDQANNRDCEVVVYKAQIEPAGDINWLTEDFNTLEFNGTILAMAGGTWDVFFYNIGTAEGLFTPPGGED